MSSGKYAIGGVFIGAAVVGVVPLFFVDYKLNNTRPKVTLEAAQKNNALLKDNKKENPLAQNDILGYYNNIPLKRSDLTSQERQSLFDSESQTYKAVENLIAKRYFDSLVQDYMNRNNITDISVAEQMLIKEKSIVSDLEVKEFIQKNSDSKQLVGKTFEEQDAIVRPYLQQQLASDYFKKVIAKASVDKMIKVTAFSQPLPPRVILKIDNSPFKGTAIAPITIVEFGDYQCQYCAQARLVVDDILEEYKGKIKFVFKNYPLTQIHSEALNAAIAAKCAKDQNQFWRMHDDLYKNQENLNSTTYKRLALEAGLNLEKFNACIRDKESLSFVTDEVSYGESLGINATPAFFVNGVQMLGVQSKSEFQKIINKELTTKM